MLKPGITRFLLASLVVLFHISRFVFLGRFAVCSFFILSGYWITLMFDQKYSKKQQPLKVFYISRVWRLLPTFYVFCILTFAARLLFYPDLIKQIRDLDLTNKIIFWISNTTLLTSYTFPKINIMAPAWSLDIELEFYLLFPLIFYASRNRREVLNWLFGVFLILSFFLCTAYTNSWIVNSLPTYLYLFVLGMIMYRYAIYFSATTEKVCLLLFMIFIGMQYVIPYAVRNYKDEWSMYYLVISFVLVMLAIPTLANSVRKYSDRKDKFWGELSFMIYFSHWVLIRPYGFLTRNSSTGMHFLCTLLFLAGTIFLALVIYWIVDRPVERLRHRWVNSRVQNNTAENLIFRDK